MAGSRVIQFEGRNIEVPADASDAEVAQILSSQPPTAPSGSGVLDKAVDSVKAAVGAQPEPAAPRTWGDTARDAANVAGQFGRGARYGLAHLLGLPVDAVNNSPRLLNLLPGVDNVGPMSPYPIGGGQNIDDALGGFGLIPEAPQPKTLGQNIARRVGTEVGAAAVPVGGALAQGSRLGIQGARTAVAEAENVIQALRAKGAEAAAVDPTGLVKREAASAVASGTGAGVANTVAGNPQEGDNFWSDFLGSAGGLGAYGLGKGVVGVGGNTLGTLFGKPRIMDDVVKEEVANRLIDNSTSLGKQFADTGTVDTQTIVDILRKPSAAEEAIPGFRANIGDRTQDPGLTTFSFNQDSVSPGAASARRANNEEAVSRRMTELAPTGNPGEFRSALEGNRSQQLAGAANKTAEARANFETAKDSVQPVMKDATARGSSLRGALQDASDSVRAKVKELWTPINESTAKVDVEPLDQSFKSLDSELSANEARRFKPAESSLPGELISPPEAKGPVPTGILDEYGTPIAREPKPGNSTQDLKEITGIRSGLTDDIIKLEASGQGGSNEARILRMYRDKLDEFVDKSVPAELRGQYETARAATRDMKDRFERPGTAIGETLRKQEAGGYQLDDSAVTSRFTPTDQGKVGDFQALIREAGTDPRARNAVADEIMTQVGRNGLVERPEALGKFLKDRSILLGEFPELKTKLEAAGVAKTTLAAAEKVEKDTVRTLTKPGQSPIANYLQYGDERTVDAMRTVINSGSPKQAAADLVAAAGGDARSLQNARAAFWEVVKDNGMNSASGATGNRVWNGRKLRDIVDDPKHMAVAQELYRDSPDELENVKKVFAALADADGSSRARVAGSSGTSQGLANKYDPAMSMTSVASRLRSVERGQLSPTIAAVDLIGVWLRRRSAQIQSRAIDTLSSAVVNNPGMAADLLESYNPANWAAKKRMLFQKYGVRATQVINLLDEAQDPEGDTKDAVMREK
jgi:hypothetical protein